MRPRTLFTAGGGRHNATMMHMLAERTGISIRPVNELGWTGDALEAQGFAYMAVRTLRGLPISFPGTTGVPEPMCGGVIFADRQSVVSGRGESVRVDLGGGR